jgi:intracellular sulfur oxidation DsrE/DsrF family protein
MTIDTMEVTMKRMLAIVACGLLAAVMVRAQSASSPKPYKVVFDLTTDDPQDQGAVLRWLREVATVNPQSEMEVVMYGRGLSLVVSGRSTMADEVKQAIGRPHVSFKVCEIAMRNQKVDKSQLLSNVAIVPDGIGEIVARQNEGWGYIKAIAH